MTADVEGENPASGSKTSTILNVHSAYVAEVDFRKSWAPKSFC
jgi:hypothetical protein